MPLHYGIGNKNVEDSTMFCDKCGMPLAICICNILLAVAGDNPDATVTEVTLQLSDGREVKVQPNVDPQVKSKA
jgi:hypothetical protein